MPGLRFKRSSIWLSLFFVSSGVVIVFLFVAWSYRAAGSAPAPQGPYPPPLVMPTFPPDYPAAKQTREVAAWQTRAAALDTPLPTPNPNPVATAVPPAPGPFQVSRRTAGMGTIFETGAAPFSSFYLFENHWRGVIGNREITVYAGAQRLASDTTALPPPLPGLLIVVVKATDHTPPSHSENGTYYLPVADGPARIVDAAGARLTVVTQSNTAYYFNVATRELMAVPGGSVERRAGEGTIVESGAVPFDVPEYTFANQWYVERPDERVTVLAGSRIGPGNWKQAVLFIAVTPPGKPLEFGDGTVYLVPRHGAVRVVGAAGDRLLLAAEFELTFDPATRQLIAPPGIVLETPAPLPTVVLPTVTPEPAPSPVPYP